MQSIKPFEIGNLESRPYIVGFGNGAVLQVPERNTNIDIRSVKYSHHKKGDKRNGDAASDEQTRITILMHGGPWNQDMWINRDKIETIELTKPGDYILWEPGWWHMWEACGDATMLTVSIERHPLPA